MPRQATIQHFLNYPVVPVFYNADKEVSREVLNACYNGGVRVFEFTNRGKNALEVFEHLADNLPQDMILGTGTVFTSAEAEDFINAGAQFIVSPCFVESVADSCYQNKIPYLPGCMTVKEIYQAMQAGCEVIKIFPGEVLGTAFIKSVKSILPSVKLMVTGGVNPTIESVQAWFSAGVSVIGMGSQLVHKEWLVNKEYYKIVEACQISFSALKKYDFQ